jgi:LacI family transcriptional regulator
VRGVETHMKAVLGMAPTVIEVGSNAVEAAKVIERWLERHSLPTAIFGVTNVTTLGALSALAGRRIEIPRQISLIGFDDYTWMSARMTPLTAIRQPVDEMARTVWKRLMERLSHPAKIPHRTELKVALEIRDSVRNLGGPSTSPDEPPLLTRSERPALPKKPIH